MVLQGADCTSLYFALEELQSRMSNSRPDELELNYTKTMMGFLLLHQKPRHIAMIGLGGGSLAKFCYRYLPDTNLTVVEINPHVIDLRQRFQIPEDGERFTVIQGDGAEFLSQADSEFDVIMVDGFDHQGQPPQLCSLRFYQDCYKALSQPGILVANLHETNPLYESFIGRIDLTFEGNFGEIVGNLEGNIIVFAGKDIAIDPYKLRCRQEVTRNV